MNNILRFIYFLFGTFIIAIGLNYFIIPNNLVSFGFDGLSCFISYLSGANVYINMFLLNLILILFSILFVKKETIYPYILPSIFIPLVSYLTKFLVNLYPIVLPEMMLNIIVASFLLGIGYSIIYKQGFKAGTIFLIEDVFTSLTGIVSKSYTIVIDIIVVILVAVFMNLNLGLYSLVMILIIRYLITKAEFGINDYKMFYIITDHEKEVKDYILNDLKYELTTLDVKGGFTKRKNHILLSVISSRDYYKLKEGIKLIDKNAFIAIVDTYDLLNRKGI